MSQRIEFTDAQVAAICRRLYPTYDVPVGAMKWALGAVGIYTHSLPDGTNGIPRADDDLSRPDSRAVREEKCDCGWYSATVVGTRAVTASERATETSTRPASVPSPPIPE